jgi:hypothetical protein
MYKIQLAIQPAPKMIIKKTLTISGRQYRIIATHTGKQEKQSIGLIL